MATRTLPHDDTGRAGSGPTLLFLHAFPLDRRMWRGQLARAHDAQLRAVAVDLPGFGEAAIATPSSVDAMADAVVATMDALALDRAVVIGLSMGGYVALAIARRAGDRLAGLVLADTRAAADSEEAKKGRASNIAKARAEGAAAVFEGMIPNAFAPTSGDAAKDALRAIARTQSVEGVVAGLEALRDRPDATATLATIRVPTTVVVGERDVITPPVEAEAMARAIPGARLVVLPGAGHFGNVESPDAFDAAILEAARR